MTNKAIKNLNKFRKKASIEHFLNYEDRVKEDAGEAFIKYGGLIDPVELALADRDRQEKKAESVNTKIVLDQMITTNFDNVKFKKDSDCPVCLNIMVEPVQLKCIHRFCLHCIKDVFSQTEILQQQCPICRADIDWKF